MIHERADRIADNGDIAVDGDRAEYALLVEEAATPHAVGRERDVAAVQEAGLRFG